MSARPSITYGGVELFVLPQSRTPFNRPPIRRRVPAMFPDVQDTQGQKSLSAVTLHNRYVVRPPLYLGQSFGCDQHLVADGINVITSYESGVTRGPQLQTPTLSCNYPTTFNAPGAGGQGGGFHETPLFSGQLYLFGTTGCACGEPIHSWNACCTTWDNSTFNTDVTGDVNDLSGVADLSGVMYLTGQALVAGSCCNNKIAYKATADGTYSEYVNACVAETLPCGINRLQFAEAVSSGYNLGLFGATEDTYDRLISLGYNSTPGDVKLVSRRVSCAASAAWTATGAGGSGNAVIPGSNPRGLRLTSDQNGRGSFLISTEAGLYMLDGGDGTASTADLHELTRWLNPGSSYTGQFIPSGSDIYATDGPHIVRLANQSGPGVINYQPTIFSEWRKGLPSCALGDVTAIAVSRARPWLYFAASGCAASKNARIYTFCIEQGKVHPALYRHGTAQRAITALAETSQDDGTRRLHALIEQAAGGDQHPFYFPDITSDPTQDACFPYSGTADAQQILFSETDRGFAGFDKVEILVFVDADCLSACNETVDIAFDLQDGCGYANETSITSASCPPVAYTDGACTAIGSKVKRMSTRMRLEGTAGATAGPTVKSVSWVYNVPPQLADGSLPVEFEVDLDFSEDAPYDGGALQAFADLLSQIQEGTANTLAMDDQTSFTGMYATADNLRDAVLDYDLESDVVGAAMRLVDGRLTVSFRKVV